MGAAFPMSVTFDLGFFFHINDPSVLFGHDTSVTDLGLARLINGQLEPLVTFTALADELLVIWRDHIARAKRRVGYLAQKQAAAMRHSAHF